MSNIKTPNLCLRCWYYVQGRCVKRTDCDSEAEYQYALEHYDELYNEAEDIAREKYYEEKYNL